jgi:hypothetical protein
MSSLTVLFRTVNTVFYVVTRKQNPTTKRAVRRTATGVPPEVLSELTVLRVSQPKYIAGIQNRLSAWSRLAGQTLELIARSNPPNKHVTQSRDVGSEVVTS